VGVDVSLACVRILRRDAARMGYTSSFTIYDQADAVRLTAYVLRDLNIDSKRFPPATVHNAISTAKNELIDFETTRSAPAQFSSGASATSIASTNGDCATPTPWTSTTC